MMVQIRKKPHFNNFPRMFNYYVYFPIFKGWRFVLIAF